MKTTNFIRLLITSNISETYFHTLSLNLPHLPVDWVMYRGDDESLISHFISHFAPFKKTLILNLPFQNLSHILHYINDFDGVHLKSHLLSFIAPLKAAILSRYKDSKKLIGYSAHSLKDIESAITLGAHYCTLSPILPTPNKAKPLGLAKLEDIPYHLRPYIIALGGIEEKHIPLLQSLDFGGFAAIRYFDSMLIKSHHERSRP